MKKTITSIVILMAVLISAFAVFTIPASAVGIADTIGPDDPIILTSNDDYYEVVLEGFQARRTYYIPLYIDQEGWRIIQTFGVTSTSYGLRMEILDANRNSLRTGGSTDFMGFGYGNNSFVHYNFTASLYYLKVIPQSTRSVRLSITLTDGYFDTTPPVITYEQITDFYSEEQSFTVSTPAKVWTLNDVSSHDGNGNGFVEIGIELESADYIEAYIINPKSLNAYDHAYIIGAYSGSISVPASVDSLYIVLMTRWDDTSNDYTVDATLTIEFLEEETDLIR